MRCAWKELLDILPVWLRQSVDRQGRDTLQELRMRRNQPPELITATGSVLLTRVVTGDDLLFCVNTASRYSPWTAGTASQGYITAPGGHRIGLCGEAVIQQGVMTGIRSPTSLCIRVARDFPGIGAQAAGLKGSILILGKPGSGKTTLLRDLIRQISDRGPGSVAVVDERGELFPVRTAHRCPHRLREGPGNRRRAANDGPRHHRRGRDHGRSGLRSSDPGGLVRRPAHRHGPRLRHPGSESPPGIPQAPGKLPV